MIRKVTLSELRALPGWDDILSQYIAAAPAWAPAAQPNFAAYQAAEDHGLFELFVYESEGVLRGFAGVMTSTSMHYDVPVPYVESLFSATPGAGIKLLRHIAAVVEARGFRELRVTCGVPGSLADRLVETFGGEPCTMIRRVSLG